MGLRLRKAVDGDLDAVLSMLNGAATWLSTRGLDQWSESPWRRDELTPTLEHGDLFVAEYEVDTVATMTLSEAFDTAFWTATDDPSSALYISHLAIDRRYAGRGIGAWMLDQAAVHAERVGKQRLRLDAWKSNERLHTYYRQQGFHSVRIVDVTDRDSGALFERHLTTRQAQ